MSELKGFRSAYIFGKHKVSKEIFEKTIVLPSNINLKYQDIKYFEKVIHNKIKKV